MSETTLIGLGVMGAALGKTLLAKGRRVTVWNRTSSRAEALKPQGAIVATDIEDAVRASPIVIVCVSDYASTLSILERADLQGKTLVQLSTGTPRESRQLEVWARTRGADYLDGAILAIPSQIGGPDSAILISGSKTALAASEPILADLVASLRYMGPDAGAASAFDLGFLSSVFGVLLGFYHGARILESEGIDVATLGTLLRTLAPTIGQMIEHDAKTVQSGRYEESPEATVKTCWYALQLLAEQARQSELDGTFPTFAVSMFERGIAAGFENEAPAALVKALRTPQKKERT